MLPEEDACIESLFGNYELHKLLHGLAMTDSSKKAPGLEKRLLDSTAAARLHKGKAKAQLLQAS